jgi:hypothetical protein
MKRISFFLSVVCGALLVLPEATRFEVSMPTPRLMAAASFAGTSLVLSLLLTALSRSSRPEEAFIRGFSFILGSIFCFSVVRQQATLMVWSALWSMPGSLLGEAFGRLFLVNTPIVTAVEKDPQGALCREQETSCSL